MAYDQGSCDFQGTSGFVSTNRPSLVRFVNETDREDVARFFEPSVAATVTSVKALIQESSVNISVSFV